MAGSRYAVIDVASTLAHGGHMRQCDVKKMATRAFGKKKRSAKSIHGKLANAIEV